MKMKGVLLWHICIVSCILAVSTSEYCYKYTEQHSCSSALSCRLMVQADLEIATCLDNTQLPRLNVTLMQMADSQLSVISNKLVQYRDIIETLIARQNTFYVLNSGSLRFCPYAKYITISSSAVATIRPHTFRGMTSMRTLDLSFNNIKYLEEHAFDISKGASERNMLAKLNLTGNSIRLISADAFEDLTHLSVLDISYNGLKYVHLNSFRGLDSLRDLRLDYNVIEYVGGSFKKMPHLMYLSMKRNSIKSLRPSMFTNIRQFLKLDFSHNEIRDIDTGIFTRDIIVDATFEDVQRKDGQIYSDIDLSHNKLFSLNESVYHHTWESSPRSSKAYRNPTIIGTRLNLSCNEISHVDYKAFATTNSIISLDLNNNMLDKFFVETNNFDILEDLYLENNSFHLIFTETFLHLSNLKHLYMSSNNIKDLERYSFVDTTNLVSINMSNNFIQEINSKDLGSLRILDTLDLSKNNLAKIDIDYKNCGNIKRLFLTANDIRRMSDINLHNLTLLEYLDLSDNFISEINYVSLTNLVSLKSLVLSQNEISILHPSTFIDMSNLQLLNASINNIFSLEYGAFQGLERLEILDLSYNEILNISTGIFFELRSLRYLYLDSNRITALDMSVFKGTTGLKLSLGGNHLRCDWLTSALQDIEKSRSRLKIVSILTTISKENVNGLDCESPQSAPETLIEDRSLTAALLLLSAVEMQNKHVEDIDERMGTVIDLLSKIANQIVRHNGTETSGSSTSFSDKMVSHSDTETSGSSTRSTSFSSAAETTIDERTTPALYSDDEDNNSSEYDTNKSDSELDNGLFKGWW